MAGNLGNKAEELALNSVFRGGITLYLGLATAAIDDTKTLATITEVTDASYARQVVTFNAPVADGTTSKIVNTGSIEFPAWTANQTSPITYAFITTAQTGTTGDIYAWFSLDVINQVTPQAGQPVRVPAGSLSISLD